jgi:signal transduction histidine kinase
LQGVHPKPSDSKTRSLIVAPVDFGEEFYGTLTLSESSPDAFGEADVKLVDGLARQLALTLHRLEIAEANSQAEQRANAAEAMSAMGQSAFELAHRLGNDLGLVRTYVENVEDILKGVNIGDLSTELAKIRRDVKKVMDLSHGLKAIFDDYRDGKRPKLLPVSIPPEVLIEETILSLPELPGNIQVSSFVEPVTPLVRADHNQVADILRNLYTNAVQAMPYGGEVTLSARHAGRYVEFQVQDTGPGISEELQKRIFDLFYSTKGSTGFGLWSARRNALANNGDLTVVSESGRGATFVLLLPRADTPAGGSER